MIAKKNLLIIWLIGLMSGFTIMITGNTLNFWLAKEEINIKTIGVFALISIPYAINFIWSPVFDIKNIPLLSKILGHRTSWIVTIQIFLSIAVFSLSCINPSENLFLFGLIALIISFFSSAQDTVLGALKTEIIDSNNQGQVSGLYVFGYRIGMLLSSSGAIYIATYIDWNLVYELFSLIIILFTITILLLVKEKNLINITSLKTNILGDEFHGNLMLQIKYLIAKILNPLGSKSYILMILLFLILYRLPDNFINMMINPFLLHIGYNDFEIATAGKFFGITSAIIGGLIAGYIMKYFTIFNGLIFFGILHGFAHILFIIQEFYGKNIYLFFLVTGFESITGGMTMAAYIAYIASLCHGKFRATQYSFLTSMMGLSRSILPSISGYIVGTIGWNIFFLSASIASIPPIILVLYLKKYSVNK
jgi:PAT family beta-lactamase induction signal transducer AmpG